MAADLSQRFTDFLPARVWVAYLLGLVASGVALAAVYTYGGGPTLAQQTENFAAVDSMLFNVAALSAAIPITGLMYYFTRDLSTSAAPLTGIVAGLKGGFEDIMVYVFCILHDQGRCADVTGFPGKWPWLDNTGIGQTVSFFGFESVTDVSIMVSAAVWILGSIAALKLVYEFEVRTLDVEMG